MKNVCLLIFLSVVPVAGYGFSTAELQAYCASPTDEKLCHGYIYGVVDASQLTSICPPSAAYHDTPAIAKKYILAHPELGTYLAVDVVRKALREAYPCQK